MTITGGAQAAVFQLLSTDSILNSVYGINESRVWPTQALDTAPRKGPFLILRWEERTVERGGFGATDILTVWAHVAREHSTDYGPLNEILERVEEILLLATHVVGVDGVLSTVDYNGRSPHLNDEGYKTITRNAQFTVLSR